MKETTGVTKKLRSLVCTVVLLSCGASAALIVVEVPEDTFFPGNNITIDITASETGAAKGIGAFDLDLSYDATILELTKYTFGDVLGNMAAGDAIDLSSPVAPGRLNFSAVSLLTPEELTDMQGIADIKLASVTFKAINGGISALSLTVNSIGDAYGEMLSCTTRDGSISVPEPSTTLLLLCSGFLLLGMASVLRRNSIWKVKRPPSIIGV